MPCALTIFAGQLAMLPHCLFTQALGAELQNHQVRVFGINPSATETDRVKSLYQKRALSKYGDAEKWRDMLDASQLPFGRLKQPDEVANQP